MITQAQLEQFTASKNDVRTYFRTPFQVNGHAFATNGHIAIVLHKFDGQPRIGEGKNEKTAAARLSKWLKENQYNPANPLPEFNLPPKVTRTCTCCKGELKTKECQHCEGEGDLYTSHGHVRECTVCSRTGRVPHPKNEPETDDTEPCYCCDDGIETEERDPVFIEGQCFSADYIELIQALPNVLFATGITNLSDKPSYNLPAAKFTFDGGEGLLMPRTK